MSAPTADAALSGPPRAEAGARTSARRQGALLALLGFAQLIVSIDYNIVYVALPDIGHGLGFTAHSLQWVVSAYAVAFGGFLLFGGRTSDLFGRRRTFVLGLLLYAASSLLGGLAGDPALLIAARALQGLGGAFVFPATLALVVTSFAEGRERNRAFSVWAGAGASGMIIGSLLGGVLTQALGWQAVFFVNVPLAAAAAALAFALIGPDGARSRVRRVDLPGALTATGGATLVVFTLVQGPVSGWTAPIVLTAGGLGLALLAAFLILQARSSDPLLPLRLFRNRNLSLGLVTTLLFMATFGTLLYFLTVYFQTVHHYSALATGIAFLPPMAAGFVGSMLGGRLATRFGHRATLFLSLKLGAAGSVLTALAMSPNGGYASLLPGLLLLSLCQGVVFTCMFAVSATGVDPYDQGVASGVVSTGQQVGSAVGLAVLIAVADAGTSGRHGEALRLATETGLHRAVLTATGGMVLLGFVALGFSRRPRSASSAASAPTAT